MSWPWIVCGRQKHVKSWFHAVPRSNPCPLLKPHISEFPPKGGLSIFLKEPIWALPPPASVAADRTGSTRSGVTPQ